MKEKKKLKYHFYDQCVNLKELTLTPLEIR